METTPAVAVGAIQTLRRRLEALDERATASPVRVRVMLTGDGSEATLESSLGRELHFAFHHAVHHHAMLKAIATEFVRAGAGVLLTARNEAMLREVQAELKGLARPGRPVEILRADVAKPEDCAATVKRAAEVLPDLCVLVNNAGVYGPKGAIEDVDWDEWVTAIEINLLGLVRMCREVIPVLREIGTDQEEAAYTLGASPWRTFWRVTLPAIRWGIIYGIILTTARALGEYGAVAIVSGKIAGKTEKETATIKPAGLGARDTLRLEAGMPLYGHELTEQIDPLSAGLNFAVDLTKDFIGAEALRIPDDRHVKVARIEQLSHGEGQQIGKIVVWHRSHQNFDGVDGLAGCAGTVQRY
jgi:hypothetical protein